MTGHEQEQAGAGGAGFGGFGGFNPFGEAFWSAFGGGARGAQTGGGAAGAGNFEDIFKEFESFFSMGDK